MQTQSRSLSGQQGPGWSLAEGPVYSNNSTRPCRLSRGRAPGARIHTASICALSTRSAWAGGQGQGRTSSWSPAWATSGRPHATLHSDAGALWHHLLSRLEQSASFQAWLRPCPKAPPQVPSPREGALPGTATHRLQRAASGQPGRRTNSK